MSKTLNISVVAAFFVLSLFSSGFSEDITITTYYPSPYGSYVELRANQMSIGSAYTGVALANGNLFVEGNVGIGTTTPGGFKVYVVGNVYVQGDIFTDDPATYPDYVFEPEYSLLSLSELGAFVESNKHLPNMPSVQEIKENGVKIFEQNRLMLEKLEEAYLYIIELGNRVIKLEAKLGSEAKDIQVK